MEGVVGRAGAVGAAVPLGEGVGHGHAAVGRGVVDDRGGAAAGSGPRARLEAVGRPVHARPALHVRVGVDEAREDPAAARVKDLVALDGLDVGRNARDLVARKRHVSHADALGRDQRAALDDDHATISSVPAPQGVRARPMRARLRVGERVAQVARTTRPHVPRRATRNTKAARAPASGGRGCAAGFPRDQARRTSPAPARPPLSRERARGRRVCPRPKAPMAK